MLIEIWSDIVCPYCMVGKAELDKALATFPHLDEITVEPRSFELQPGAAVEPVVDHLVKKYGMTAEQVEAQSEQIAQRAESLGLTYNWRTAINAPTLDAHRIVKLAATRGLAPEVEAALMYAHFTGGRDISDHAVLTDIATSAGLPGERVAEVLASDEFADAVYADGAEAAELGITGVPFFIIDGKFGISGAQPSELFVMALGKVWTERHPFN